jgi:hypothetical protein
MNSLGSMSDGIEKLVTVVDLPYFKVLIIGHFPVW